MVIPEMVPNGVQLSRIADERSSDGADDNDGTFRVPIAKEPNISPEKELMNFIAIISNLPWIAFYLGVGKSLLVPVMRHNNYLWLNTFIVLFEGIHMTLSKNELALYHMHNMQQLPNSICIFSRFYYWVDFLSVIISGVLSVIGLALLHHMHYMQHGFRKRDEALIYYVFYCMTISEVLVFLTARAIWKWKVSYCRLLEKVKDKLRLEKSDMDLIKRFFYDMHYKCMIDGKIIESLESDLITFAGDLLVKNEGEDKILGAARILMAFVRWDDSVRKIVFSKDVIQRLIQILNFQNLFEENTRYIAAVIVSQLVNKEPKVRSMAGMEEAMKSVKHLLDARGRATATQG